MLTPTLVVLVAAAVVGVLVGVHRGNRSLEATAKPVASVAFVALGARAWQGGDPVATWLVVGLVLCAAGDVFLLWDRTFDAGLWTFLLGHVAYIGAFHTAWPAPGWNPWIGLVLAVCAVGVGRWLWPHLGRRRFSVSAYIVVISVMVWAAVSGAVNHRLSWPLAAGAVLFYLSDLTVARHRFVAAEFRNRAFGLPTYYTAQVLIALSV